MKIIKIFMLTNKEGRGVSITTDGCFGDRCGNHMRVRAKWDTPTPPKKSMAMKVF